MSYGTAYVTLPPGHVVGRVEQRRRYQIFYDANDAGRFVVIHPLQILTRRHFADDVSAHVREAPKRDVLVFVHGYNVGFDDGLKRLAQMTVDLGFEGAPILYSWPSKKGLLGYGADAAAIRATVSNLERFLTDVVLRTGADRVYLLAHSLGNDALTSALQLIARSNQRGGAAPFRHVVHAAPDVDRGAFEAVVPQIVSLGHLVTLYSSSQDLALAASSGVVHRYARAGQTSGLVVIPPMETIDATGIDSSFLKHSYFGSVDPVLGDIHSLLFDDTRADDRYGLVYQDTDARGRFWQFAPRK